MLWFFPSSSVDKLAVEGNTHGAEQETGVLVGVGAGVDGDVATGDHFGRVPIPYQLDLIILGNAMGKNLHIIVHLNLREQSHLLRLKTESDVTTAVTTATLHTLPILESGHDNIDQLSEEMQHVLTAQLGLGGNGITTGGDVPLGNAGLGLEGLDLDVGHGLQGHTGDVQP